MTYTKLTKRFLSAIRSHQSQTSNAIIVCYCLHETAKYILHTINLKNLVSSTKFEANNMANYCIKSTKDLQMLGKLFIWRKLALHKTFLISIWIVLFSLSFLPIGMFVKIFVGKRSVCPYALLVLDDWLN